MVTIRLARHGAKSVRSTVLLSLTAVMHATVAFIERVGFFNPIASEKKKALARSDRIAHWVGRRNYF